MEPCAEKDAVADPKLELNIDVNRFAFKNYSFYIYIYKYRMVFMSFKSFIPFPTPPSIKKYLDDCNKQMISRILDYHENIEPTKKLFRQNFNNTNTNTNANINANINSNTNINYIKYNNGNDKQLISYDNPPTISDPKYGLLLFSMSSLFFFLLHKKFF
jgi:hypothetical protein